MSNRIAICTVCDQPFTTGSRGTRGTRCPLHRREHETRVKGERRRGRGQPRTTEERRQQAGRSRDYYTTWKGAVIYAATWARRNGLTELAGGRIVRRLTRLGVVDAVEAGVATVRRSEGRRKGPALWTLLRERWPAAIAMKSDAGEELFELEVRDDARRG